MKRSLPSLIAMTVLLAASGGTFGQSCLTGGSFTVGTTNTFNTTSEGFTGDFSWTSGGSGMLETTNPVSGTQSEVLTTSTFFLPNSASTIAWSFNLSGTASVSSYTVEALYSNGSSIVSVPVCSGTALTTTGANLVFAAVAPAQIIGTNFRLKITFTATAGGGNKVLDIDNFKTNATNAAAALPVTFSYFNGKLATGGVLLTWLVSAEVNVNHYDIERSSNGKSFSKIGQVSASGLTTYTYTDTKPNTGSNYYRVKDVDNDGTYKYSSVVLVKVGKTSLASTLKLYPMPAINEVTLQHDVATNVSTISVLSVDGKVIKTVKPAVGNEETSINVSSLKSGLYLIRYSVDGESATIKLVKQ